MPLAAPFTGLPTPKCCKNGRVMHYTHVEECIESRKKLRSVAYNNHYLHVTYRIFLVLNTLCVPHATNVVLDEKVSVPTWNLTLACIYTYTAPLYLLITCSIYVHGP